jgi:glycosyltransferase involved in cell wall biosynthesis
VDDGVTGRLVAPRDHAAMARAIVQLLRDEPARARMGLAGLQRVNELFTVDRMLAETARVYARVKRTKQARVETAVTDRV